MVGTAVAIDIDKPVVARDVPIRRIDIAGNRICAHHRTGVGSAEIADVDNAVAIDVDVLWGPGCRSNQGVTDVDRSSGSAQGLCQRAIHIIFVLIVWTGLPCTTEGRTKIWPAVTVHVYLIVVHREAGTRLGEQRGVTRPRNSAAGKIIGVVVPGKRCCGKTGCVTRTFSHAGNPRSAGRRTGVDGVQGS